MLEDELGLLAVSWVASGIASAARLPVEHRPMFLHASGCVCAARFREGRAYVGSMRASTAVTVCGMQWTLHVRCKEIRFECMRSQQRVDHVSPDPEEGSRRVAIVHTAEQLGVEVLNLRDARGDVGGEDD